VLAAVAAPPRPGALAESGRAARVDGARRMVRAGPRRRHPAMSRWGPEEASARGSPSCSAGPLSGGPQQSDYAAASHPRLLLRASKPGPTPSGFFAEAGTGCREDARLHRRRQPLGGEETGAPCGSRLTTRNLQTQIAGRARPTLSRSRTQTAQSRDPQGTRELPLPVELRGTRSAPRWAGRGRPAGHLGLIARWIAASEAGDLVGG